MVIAESETPKTESAVATASKESEVKPSEDNKAVSTSKTYTEEQLRKAISNALATQGGTLGRERDTFKAQSEKAALELKSLNDRVAELQSDRDQLKSDIESLSEEDPEKAGKLSQRLKAMDAAIKAAKDKESAADNRVNELEGQMKPYAETVNWALGESLKRSVKEIAGEYDGGNAEVLTGLCDEMGVKGDKDTDGLKTRIRKVADILWSKKAGEKEPEAVIDSGVTNGGSFRTKFAIQKDYASSKINLGQYMKEMAAHGFRID